MICPSSGDDHIDDPPCNCCLAPTGCTIYDKDDLFLCTAHWNVYSCDVNVYSHTQKYHSLEF